jgi:hypothetical protein
MVVKDEGLQCSYQSVKSTAWSKGSAETLENCAMVIIDVII